MTTDPVAPPPDDKDWTWVISRPCPDCGFDAVALDTSEIPARTRETMAAIVATLSAPDAVRRPALEVWSPLEYACHVRDVCRLFDRRLALMLTEHDPLFDNWDQDETALDERYWAQDPATVARECVEAADGIASSFERVSGEQWQRPGRRSNGSVFTVDTFGRYFVHDLVHHRHDIGA